MARSVVAGPDMDCLRRNVAAVAQPLCKFLGQAVSAQVVLQRPHCNASQWGSLVRGQSRSANHGLVRFNLVAAAWQGGLQCGKVGAGGGRCHKRLRSGSRLPG